MHTIVKYNWLSDWGRAFDWTRLFRDCIIAFDESTSYTFMHAINSHGNICLVVPIRTTNLIGDLIW